MRRAAKTDDEIRAAILAAYRDHRARGLMQPMLGDLWRACGTKSGRVSRLHRAMRREGQMPELPTSQAQRGGMAIRQGYRCPVERRPKPEPARAAPTATRPELSRWQRLIRVAMGRERRIRAAVPGWLAQADAMAKGA